MSTSETSDVRTGMWNDPRASPEERAAALLAELTPQEKLAQLVSTWPGSEELEEAVAPLQESHLHAPPFADAIADGIGHLTRPFGTAPIDPVEGVHRLRNLQRQVVAANRFGIPAIAHEECLTGLTAWQATVYPTPLALAATFDPDLVRQMAGAIGQDMASIEVHQGLAPVLDVVRDYRWGRVEETFGEDPYLVSEFAAAYVSGLQSAGVIATLKHFAGYSASRGARNHAPVSIGERELRDVILLPFEKAVVKAGARSVMNSYTELDGIPTASDERLLTQVLRDEWGFTGTVVSDYWAIGFLASMHHLVDDFADAGALALTAGIDVELPHALGYSEKLLDRIPAAVLDRAVLRVLTQKAELGLLDPAPASAGDPAPVLDSERNRALARRLADESVVLLANDRHVLPLAAGARRIAVIGPAADDPACLFGCYSFPNHVLPNFPDAALGVGAPTVLDALRAEFPDAQVDYQRGGEILTGDASGVAAAVAAAGRADLVVLVVGDRSGMFGHGSSGEGCDVLDLSLPGSQEQLVEAVLATDVPVIMVVVSGRPYAIGRHVTRSAAALQVFFPGQEGAAAIAGVLSGRVEPSGRLPVQIPGDTSAQPGTYLAPALALRSEGISNIDPTPAYPFGFGLGYTDFAFDDLVVSDAEIATSGEVVIGLDIENTGTRTGFAVPQLYLSDPVARVTRPVRQLVGLGRVSVEPGQRASVEFRVSADLASYTGRDRRRVVEPGEIVLTVAADAADPGRSVSIMLTGPERIVDHTRVMTCGFDVRVADPGR
jgi:beta-xylosidase